MKSTSFVFVILILVTSLPIIPGIHADEDEDDETDDRIESGNKEREREREQEREMEREEDEDGGGVALGSGMGDIILYGTIAAIFAAIGYSSFKIISSRKKSQPKASQ